MKRILVLVVLVTFFSTALNAQVSYRIKLGSGYNSPVKTVLMPAKKMSSTTGLFCRIPSIPVFARFLLSGFLG